MRGSSCGHSPGFCARAGPRNDSGEARLEKIGSVSTLRPPSCTSTVAWPIHVTVGTIAAPAFALLWTNPRSGTSSASAVLAAPAAVAPGLPLPAQQRHQAARLEVDVVVLERAVAVVRCAALHRGGFVGARCHRERQQHGAAAPCDDWSRAGGRRGSCGSGGAVSSARLERKSARGVSGGVDHRGYFRIIPRFAVNIDVFAGVLVSERKRSARYACSLGRRRSGRRALSAFDAIAGGSVSCSKPAGVPLAGDRGASRGRWGGGAVGVAARWRTGTCVVGVVWRRHGGGAGCVVGARHDQPAVQLVARGLGRQRHGVGDGEDRSDGGFADGGAKLVRPLSWPALLAALAACLSVYWFALLWRGRKS